MGDKPKEPVRRISIWDGLVIAAVLGGVSFLQRASQEPVVEPTLPEKTTIENGFGRFEALVGSERYGESDPLRFFSREWPQETTGDLLHLTAELFRLNWALEQEWTAHHRDIQKRSDWLFKRSQRGRGTPPEPKLVRDPEWPRYLAWWERVGRYPEKPFEVWNTINEDYEVYRELRYKESLSQAELETIAKICRKLGETGVGLKFTPGTNILGGHFDFRSPVAETSSLANVMNLRAMLKMMASAY